MTCDLRAVATGLYCQFTVHSFTVHSFGLPHEGIGENHQESVRGIGVEDGGGVEAERAFEEKPYGGSGGLCMGRAVESQSGR